MCYFMFVETNSSINEDVILRNEKSSLYVQNLSNIVKTKYDKLYHISNGHCACDIVVSPHRLTENVLDIIKNIDGEFKFIIIDSNKEDVEPLLEENNDFDMFLSKFKSEEISLDEFIKKYPKEIQFDVLYKIKR
ncbi:hypothetical protein [Thermobrachium celere]|uniref:Uncharacterized protein n=1 Tax=Thermobrachium celere DSM 8682 TaxID=941824 RepID=R7RSL1_9CLOT|nr:hypothetical protein [Thermobrachium celere]GFR36567.1 hypothetical protein TCEA9_23790 [Thermobrachium celere]CDF59182.1 hypothetical protein TCEL_02250 [Thermobrachium celere DSM 8682]